MKTSRLGFGATFTRGKTHLVVSGGFTQGFVPTKKTEIYNIAKNTWAEAKDMVEARTAHSLCDVGNGQFIYAFGGQDVNSKTLDTIERARISGNNQTPLESAIEAWELVSDIKLQEPICNIGCLSVSRNEILLFGGLNSQAKEVKNGVVLMCLGGSHNYLEE